MNPRAIEETKATKRTDESFDFPETSDMCDFGYELAIAVDHPTAPAQASTQTVQVK